MCEMGEVIAMKYVYTCTHMQGLIENRVGPWINKKITEYIGEAEPILTEFICNKLSCHISPSDILNDISMVSHTHTHTATMIIVQ